MSHSHAGCHHDHHHAVGGNQRAFAWGVALNLAFVGIEAACGFWSHSTALLADAGHNLSDVLGLLIAWGATRLSAVGPDERRTYGFRRSSIMAALANALILLVATGGITWEAVLRLITPQPVGGTTMMIVAAVGVIVNGATAFLFFSGRHHDLNIRGAFLHMAADAVVSLGVVVSGALIAWKGWLWIDPLASLLIVAVIVFSTWGLLIDSINLALDAVPKGIDPVMVRDYLRQLPGITDVHDLHIWGMSTTETALTVHLVKPDGLIDDAFLADVEQTLRSRFKILHPTVQLERGDQEHACVLSGVVPVTPREVASNA
jgi:cobalt-zinc-cadmium efflux system protein